MAYASALELYMLELINQERSSRDLGLLKLETNLNQSAEDHSQWMLSTNVFSHTGVDDTSATQRMRAAGFDLAGSWSTAENIAVQSERGAQGYRDDVADLHTSLMNSAGHRENLLNPDLEYVGIGIEVGSFSYSGGYTLNSVMVTQNFGRTGGSIDLDDMNGGKTSRATGTAGNDTINGGDGNDTINGGDGDDRLWAGNGNDLAFGGWGNDMIGGMDGFDTIWGGNGNDTIWGGGWADTLGGAQGNDSIMGDNGNDLIWGGDGNDTIDGGAHNDTLRGGSNNDLIRGGDGNDDVNGGWGWDDLDGGEGNDLVDGFMGNDVVRGGGGNDLLLGGPGNDTLNGGTGSDTLYAGWGNDVVTGGGGADIFVFGFDAGRDVYTDFNAGEGDRLRIDDVLWTGTLTTQQLISTYGSVQNGSFTFNFTGGEQLVMNGVTDLTDALFIF